MSQGWSRRCENGAFGTEIVRGIVWDIRTWPETPKKRKIARSDFLTAKSESLKTAEIMKKNTFSAENGLGVGEEM